MTCKNCVILKNKIQSQRSQIANLTAEIENYKRILREKNNSLACTRDNAASAYRRLQQENQKLKEQLNDVMDLIPTKKGEASGDFGAPRLKNFDMKKLNKPGLF